MHFDQSLGKSMVRSTVAASLLRACAAQVNASVTNPTIGPLLCSEEFNGTTLNTNVWTPYNGDGCQIALCGYGNAELESYSPNNLSIVDVPFEPGTRALAIQARREVAGTSQFTSGKIDSYNKVQVQYGMISGSPRFRRFSRASVANRQHAATTGRSPTTASEQADRKKVPGR